MRFIRSLLFILVFSPSFLYAQNWDINLLKDIHVNRNKSLDPTMKFVSGSLLPISAAIPAGVITYALIRKGEEERKNALSIATAVGSAAVLTYATKYTVNRKRPYEKYDFIEALQEESSPAFPSGHASVAFSLATSLSLTYSKWYVVVPSFLWAGTMGYSRMHLGVHYPSDVLVGAIIGSGSAVLSHHLRGWLNSTWEKKISPRTISPTESPSYDDLVGREAENLTLH